MHVLGMYAGGQRGRAGRAGRAGRMDVGMGMDGQWQRQRQWPWWWRSRACRRSSGETLVPARAGVGAARPGSDASGGRVTSGGPWWQGSTAAGAVGGPWRRQHAIVARKPCLRTTWPHHGFSRLARPLPALCCTRLKPSIADMHQLSPKPATIDAAGRAPARPGLCPAGHGCCPASPVGRH